MLLLKQSTAYTAKIGPFIDDADGKTAETGLTIAQADVRLSKNGGNIAQKNEATSCTHDELGYYDCPLNTTDTNTLGKLQLMVHESGALPVWHEFMVLPANVYDSLVAGSDTLEADLTQIGGAAQSATDLKDFADAGYDPATNKVEGVKLVDTTTTNTDMVTEPPTVAEIQAEMEENGASILDALRDGLTDQRMTNLDELGAANLPADIDAILADTNELQGDWVNGGRLDLLIDAIKAVTDLLPDAGALSDLATILADTNELQADDVPGLIAALNDLSAAQVNTEVDNALDTAIPATPTADSINEWLTVIKRNTSNKMEITEANGNVVVRKDDDTTAAYSIAAAFTSDATTTTRKQIN